MLSCFYLDPSLAIGFFWKYHSFEKISYFLTDEISKGPTAEGYLLIAPPVAGGNKSFIKGYMESSSQCVYYKYVGFPSPIITHKHTKKIWQHFTYRYSLSNNLLS